MNKFNWSKLKNDPRLSPAQKKTVNKILVSLQIPARDRYRNRPALNFNIFNTKFRKANGEPNIPKINAEVRRRVQPKNAPQEAPILRARPQLITKNNQNKNLAAQMLRQHRQAYGN